MLATAVSDQPGDIGDFERMVLTVNEIWVHEAGAEDDSDPEEDTTTDQAGEDEDTSGDTDTETTDGQGTAEEPAPTDEEEGITKIQLDEPAEFDLVELQGDNQAFIDEEMLPVGEYSQIKLWVGDEVDAVLTDGSSTEVMTPGNAPLKFNQDFEIRENTRTEFTADFAPHKRGPSNGYILRPVAAETTVSYVELEQEDTTEESNSS